MIRGAILVLALLLFWGGSAFAQPAGTDTYKRMPTSSVQILGGAAVTCGTVLCNDDTLIVSAANAGNCLRLQVWDRDATAADNAYVCPGTACTSSTGGLIYPPNITATTAIPGIPIVFEACRGIAFSCDKGTGGTADVNYCIEKSN